MPYACKKLIVRRIARAVKRAQRPRKVSAGELAYGKRLSMITKPQPADIEFFKESLKIVKTGKDSKGVSYNSLGTLTQAAQIGEKSGALIAEIEYLRQVRDFLASSLEECLAVVAVQNGNLHKEVNQIQERAKRALAFA